MCDRNLLVYTLLAAFSADTSGHALETMLARKLLQEQESWELVCFAEVAQAPAGDLYKRQMPGIVELGAEIFHMPVRQGLPKYHGSLADVVQSPRFSTAFGLLLEAQTQRKRGQKVSESRSMKDVMSRMRTWFAKNF